MIEVANRTAVLAEVWTSRKVDCSTKNCFTCADEEGHACFGCTADDESFEYWQPAAWFREARFMERINNECEYLRSVTELDPEERDDPEMATWSKFCRDTFHAKMHVLCSFEHEMGHGGKYVNRQFEEAMSIVVDD